MIENIEFYKIHVDSVSWTVISWYIRTRDVEQLFQKYWTQSVSSNIKGYGSYDPYKGECDLRGRW